MMANGAGATHLAPHMLVRSPLSSCPGPLPRVRATVTCAVVHTVAHDSLQLRGAWVQACTCVPARCIRTHPGTIQDLSGPVHHRLTSHQEHTQALRMARLFAEPSGLGSHLRARRPSHTRQKKNPTLPCFPRADAGGGRGLQRARRALRALARRQRPGRGGLRAPIPTAREPLKRKAT